MPSLRLSCCLLALAGAVALSGCARRPAAYYAPPVAAAGGPYVPAGGAYAMPGYGQGYGADVYILDTGDRVRVSVFGQEGVSNSYYVDAAGNVNVALIGPVPARGVPAPALAQVIASRLRDGFVRDPRVSVEVETYRPFYILGEVNAPGQYPYQPGMSIETAVAIAGGYSPRADKRGAMLTRSINGYPAKTKVPLQAQVRPGDTINVAERWF
jgi:polysaccharide export outer membrane protein